MIGPQNLLMIGYIRSTRIIYLIVSLSNSGPKGQLTATSKVMVWK